MIYQTVFASRQEELDAFLRAMHEELKRVSPDADGIIWWRIRPRQEPPLTRAGAPRIRCRLETSPPLSRNWWMAHAFLVVDDPADTTQRWQVNPLP